MTRSKASERLVWAVKTLRVQPADRLLEIGCGHGVAVSLVCELLNGGHILAIDRSAKMIAMANERNAANITAGLASFQNADLLEADLGDIRFDKVFAIHVGVFARGNPERELAIIRAHLVDEGRFYLPYQPLNPETIEMDAERLAAMLTAHGFVVDETVIDEITTGSVGCVSARLESRSA